MLMKVKYRPLWLNDLCAREREEMGSMCGGCVAEGADLFVSNTDALCVNECVVLSRMLLETEERKGLQEQLCIGVKAYWTIKTEAVYCAALCGAD